MKVKRDSQMAARSLATICSLLVSQGMCFKLQIDV